MTSTQKTIAFVSRFSFLAFTFCAFLLSFNVNAQVIIKERVEINPEASTQLYYPAATFEPCGLYPVVSNQQYVYSCSAFPVEPYQQLFPYQSSSGLQFSAGSIYEIEITEGIDYAYIERIAYTDSLGNFYEAEYLGSLITGLPGYLLSGTGKYQGWQPTGTFLRENSTNYYIHFDNYSLQQTSVTVRITNLNTQETTYWKTVIVNPQLQIVNQQYENDTLLHYYSKDVSLQLYNINSAGCQHPGYGGCPPDNVRFNIEIIEGQQYGNIKNGLTGDFSTSFTGIPYNELYTFTYYANGLQPEDSAVVRIRHSSNDADITPIEFSFVVKRNTIPPPSEGGSIYVKMDKNVVIPGDTVNVQLRLIDETGDTVDFLAMQSFSVDLAEGAEYGTILDIITEDTSDSFADIGNMFKIIIEDQITPQQAKIIVVAQTDLMIWSRPVSINNKTKEKEHTADIVHNGGGTTPDIIIIGDHLVGVGEITITKSPIIVEILPAVINAGDTAQIIPKKLNSDGTTTAFDSLQSFEIGMLEGCEAGQILFGDELAPYFNNITQPIYFVADSNLTETDTVKIRVGLIEGSASRPVKTNGMDEETLVLNKNKSTQQKPLKENTAAYCFIGEIDLPKTGDGILVVGNECGSGAPICNTNVEAPLSFKEDVVEWTGNYVFYKEGYYPDTLKITSGGLTYFLRDGEFKLIPTTAPSRDKIYAIPLSGSFYGLYEIETCFNKKLNNGKGAYQYTFKSISETDNFIHKPIIIQIYDYSNDPYEMKSESDLATISFDKTCEAIIDFEYQRYRASSNADNFFDKYNVLYGIVDAYWEHEKYHKRDAMRFLNSNYDKKKLKILKPDGMPVSKTLKGHFNTTFACDEDIKSFNEAKIKGEEYIKSALKEYQKFFEEKWLKGDVYIYEHKKWYNETELYAHWSESVQTKISRYQSLLASRPGYNPTQCEVELKEIRKLWEPFKKYRNSL
ncbi:MAG: hypothetical protein WA440_06420 [Ignavibacteriaceae bacterium]